MAPKWYYKAEGVVVGPLALEALRLYARLGYIKPNTNIRKGELGEWVNALAVNGLFEKPTTKQSPPKKQIMVIELTCPTCLGMFHIERTRRRGKAKCPRCDCSFEIESKKKQSERAKTRKAIYAVSLFALILIVGSVSFAIFIAKMGQGKTPVATGESVLKGNANSVNVGATSKESGPKLNPAMQLILEHGKSMEIPPERGKTVPPEYESGGWHNTSRERQKFETDQMIRQGVKPSDAKEFIDTLFELEREHQRRYRK